MTDLKYKIRYLISISIAIIIAGTLFNKVFSDVENEILAQLEGKLKIHARQASESIEKLFSNYKSDLIFLSNQKSVRDLTPEGKELLIDYFSSHKNSVKALTRIDKDGKIEYTVPYNSKVIGADLTYQEHNAIIKKEHKPIISDAFTTVQGFKAVSYLYPIFSETGEYEGCLGILIPFDFIAAQYLRPIKIGERGFAWLLSEEGIELYCNYETHIGLPIWENTGNNSTLFAIVDSMLKKKSGFGVYKHLLNEYTSKEVGIKHVYYYPILLENTFWSIAVAVPEKEVLSTMTTFRDYYIVIVILLGIILIGIGYSFYRFRLKAYQAIKKQEEIFQAIAAENNHVVYEYDISKDELILSGATSELLGFSSEGEITMDLETFSSHISHEYRESFMEKINETIVNEHNINSEYLFIRSNGNRLFIEDHGVIVKDSSGHITGISGTLRDVTSRKEAEEELKQHKDHLEQMVYDRTKELELVNKELEIDIEKRVATEEELRLAKEAAERADQLKSEFLAQMSHEIRTPINTILNFTSLLKMDYEEGDFSEEAAEYFDSIENASRRLIRTIDLILNMSDIELGTYNMRRIELDIATAIIDPVIREFSPKAEKKGLKLSFSNNLLVPRKMVDEYTLTQIVANLIDNAIKYTHNGLVEIELNDLNGKWVIDVKDTGIGMSEKYIPKLFSKFSQEEQGYSRRFEGSGLGLALVKRYCELNNAEIKVTSTKGIGTHFSVLFS